MTVIGESLDPNKHWRWNDITGKDPGIKQADKTEDKVSGDAYDYAGTTKAGIGEERLHANAREFAEIAVELFPVGHKIEQSKEGLLLLKTLGGIAKDAAEGKITKSEAAALATAEVGKFAAAHALDFKPGGIALVMGKAVMMAVPKMIEEQKQDEQLYHDEGIRLMVARHFQSQMPETTYTNADKGMSAFGTTFRKTETFDKSCAQYEAGLKTLPNVEQEMQKRFWGGKSAALDLGIKGQADVDKLLDPKNQSPKAVQFRKIYNEPTNEPFRLGVRAMIDEQAAPAGSKGKALYDADLAKYNADKAVLDAKAVPVKS